MSHSLVGKADKCAHDFPACVNWGMVWAWAHTKGTTMELRHALRDIQEYAWSTKNTEEAKDESYNMTQWEANCAKSHVMTQTGSQPVKAQTHDITHDVIHGVQCGSRLHSHWVYK